MYASRGYKVYGQEQVIRGEPHFDTYFIDESKYRDLESCATRPGDVLVSLVGTIGKVLVLPEDAKAGVINPRLIKLSFASELVTPEYAHVVLSSPLTHSYYRRASQGSTMDILNLAILRGLSIPLPPLAEQAEIVRRVARLIHMSSNLDGRVDAAALRVAQSTQSILAKAFRAELSDFSSAESAHG